MCTKAVSVNVRTLSEKLQVPVAVPQTTGKTTGMENREEGDVLPTDLSPVITHHRPREIQYMRWGLVPATTVDLASVPAMFNARSETLTELRSFRDLIMTHRCLILNRGFYEHEKQGDERVTWKISPAGEEFFYKAGLWTTWRGAGGQLIESFTMITCDPLDTAMSRVHHRMPIILNKAERRLWMNPNAAKEQLLALLKPCLEEMYTIGEHSRKPLKEPKAPKKSKQDNDNLLF